MPTFPSSTLFPFARAIFEAVGVPADEAAIVAESLVDANLCGHDSHGLIRIPQYLKGIDDGNLTPGAPLTVVHETPAVLVADGGWGLGQVQAHRLLRRLIGKAREVGIAAGTLKHCGHIGRLGEYAEAAAREQTALIGTVNGHGYGKNVAPPGGTDARLGTNPLCMGAPTDREPVILDIGTSVCAEGKVRVCFNKGVPVPDGWLIDADGKPTTDPGVLYRQPRGSILPLGGAQAYKGFGIALLLEMYAGGLSGRRAATPRPRHARRTQFSSSSWTSRRSPAPSTSCARRRPCRSTSAPPRAAGVEEILLPGDPERREKSRRQKAGLVLDDGTWGQLTQIAARLNVPVPT